MASFLNGPDCGPTTTLKTVTGRLERDNAIHQDRFISQPNIAGPSTQPFSHRHSGPARAPAIHRPGASRTPFDLSSLRSHLSSPSQAPQLPAPADWATSFDRGSVAGGNRLSNAPSGRSSPWGDDFLRNQSHSSRNQNSGPFNPINHEPPGRHQVHQDTTTHATAWPSQGQVFNPQFAGPAVNGFASISYVQQGPYQSYDPGLDVYGATDAEFHQPYGGQQFSPEGTRQPATDSGISHQQASKETVSTADRQEVSAEPLTSDQELLAQTAENLVNGLNSESQILKDNPKLGQSDFFKLVQALGERKVVVEEGKPRLDSEEVGEGAKLVSRTGGSDWSSAFLHQTPTTIGQTSNLNPVSSGQVPTQNINYPSDQQQVEWDRQFADQEAILQTGTTSRPRSKSVHFNDDEEVRPMGNGIPSSLEEALLNATAMPGSSSAWQEEGMDNDLDFDEETFQQFNGNMRVAHSPRIGIGAMESWGSLQGDWDTFQRENLAHHEDRGRYLFQSGNPYTTSGIDIERFGRESPTLKGVLELEGEVQADPQNHEVWYALGLKQQENEREDQAILALSKVIELDPTHRPAYLALGVSYTNEGNKKKANDMLQKWIELGSGSAPLPELAGLSLNDKRERLVERLIEMAQQSPEEVDADIQIALGVIFNASEDWDKAEDCFFSALSVRPDDWLLYNRLGATMANSGRSAKAIEYYHHALSLHPNFVRALFNLGIAHSNIGQYPMAAQKILDALRLQHADATEGYSSYAEKRFSVKGVTSDTLWTTLRNACLHMGRQDLVALASNRDLAAFPLSFDKVFGDQQSEVTI